MASVTCAGCGISLGADELQCPVCRRLVHAARVAELQNRARVAEMTGNPVEAVARLREAALLLPPGSPQWELVQERIRSFTLSVAPPAAPPPAAPPPSRPAWAQGPGQPQEGWRGKLGGALGAAAVAAWKFKTALLFLFTKGKLLLFGLTKLSTFGSMALTALLYAQLFGWQWAVGFVLCIYVHEMGHVFAFRRYGIEASAPMFVPFVGAFVRGSAYPRTVSESAHVGMAGPIFGLGAGAASLLLHWFTDAPVFAAIAHTAAWLNLFNLLPVGGLDGARGMEALSRTQRWMVVGMFGLGWLVSGEILFFIVGAVAAFTAWRGEAQPVGDRAVLFEWGWVIGGAAALCALTAGVVAGA